MMPKSFQIVAKMVQNRSLEGVWGCFAACLRPKAPMGRFQDASGAALGRFLGHLGRLLGVLKASRRCLEENLTPKWNQVGIKA